MCRLSPREVLLARGDGDVLALDEVAHEDGALRDLCERAAALVVGEPLGASDRCRTEAADRLELAGSLAPQVADLSLGVLLRRRCLGSLRTALEVATRELQVGGRALG